MPLQYIAGLSGSKSTLWCFLIWYLCMISLYFDNSAILWLNSFGLAIVVGFALFLSTGPATLERFRLRFWESIRLFMCPFLVSSFSALVKGQGFILLLSPRLEENLLASSFCLVFLLAVKGLQQQRGVQ